MVNGIEKPIIFYEEIRNRANSFLETNKKKLDQKINE